MTEVLFTIEDAFEITRGLVVVPGPLAATYRGSLEFPVLLKMPNGGEQLAELVLGEPYRVPHSERQEHRCGCMLRGMTKVAVPIGTQVWTVDA